MMNINLYHTNILILTVQYISVVLTVRAHALHMHMILYMTVLYSQF